MEMMGMLSSVCLSGFDCPLWIKDQRFGNLNWYFLYVGEKPTNRDLTLLKWRDGGEVRRLKLVDTILNDWRTIGNILGISQSKLDAWWTQTNHDPKRCCDKVLAHWLQNPPEEYSPTWRGQIDLLKDAEFSTLVQELKKAIVNKVYSGSEQERF